MSKFYNPYHFVPVEKPSKAQQESAIPKKQFPANPNRPWVTHERYVPDTVSGRLVARLTTVTPTVVGADQDRKDKKDFATVEPYLVSGRAAIPGSTLRGLVGSVIEAASNGAMRVLEDRPYSYRRKMQDSLSAIGVIVKVGVGFKLLPLCLPTLESRDGGRSFEAPARFRGIFPTPQFKVYLGDAIQIRDVSFGYRTAKGHKDAVPMPVKRLAWSGNSVVYDRSLHVKANRYAVSQDPDTSDAPRMGLVRVLGCWGRRTTEIPNSKKHELWVPLPGPEVKALPILPNAIDRFHTLADERTDEDASLPFHPLDTRRNENPEDKDRFRLKANDLVYFDVNDKGEVKEISLSAIWRGLVVNTRTGDAATAYSFFRSVDPELLPFNPDRKAISVAEQILGFAEDRSEEQKTEEGGLALASRLRFADALLPEGSQDPLAQDFIPLKILGSPKTPCPALYFKSATGRGAYIGKRDLDPALHAPQGRKWYLHGQSKPGEEPWRTEYPNEEKTKKQKNLVRPIAAGHTFYFHIDFDNLSEVEVGLLLYALEPDAAFHHKIGMGKPLGLGSVKIEVLGYFPVDRAGRYSVAGLRAERYGASTLTAAGETIKASAKWPDRYREEGKGPAAAANPLQAAREAALGSGLVSAAARKALERLGNYSHSPQARDVRYPTNTDQRDKETEHFKWFVFNDGQRERGRGMTPRSQFLKPLTGETGLPPLDELEWEPPPPPRRY
ncbi:MAG: TIGR03986 family CRISPR-associated RAMP protein [Planctomycetota bacterium]